jgi:hypothetical protein
MKETILSLYEEMERAIVKITTSASGPAVTEQYYQVTDQYWQLAKQQVRQSGFADDMAEIEFFKHLKPKFTGPLEYYLLLFRYQKYVEAGPAALEKLRLEELDRIHQFKEKHAVFIDYYEQGRTEWDDVYFLRRKFNRVQRPPSQVYDRVTDYWTNGDWIVTLYLANKRLETFIQSGIPSPSSEHSR